MDEKSVGRPQGKPYPVLKQIRLSTRDAERLRRLAGSQEQSEAAVVRGLIRDATRREGLEEGGTE